MGNWEGGGRGDGPLSNGNGAELPEASWLGGGGDGDFYGGGVCYAYEEYEDSWPPRGFGDED